MKNDVHYLELAEIKHINVSPEKIYNVERNEAIPEVKNFFGIVRKKAVPASVGNWHRMFEKTEDFLKWMEGNGTPIRYLNNEFYTSHTVNVITKNYGTKVYNFETWEKAIEFAEALAKRTGLECTFADPKKVN